VQPIFVGDVQGCGAELAELVARADARFGSDWELWLVGDLVNRGPDNLPLLREVRERVERGRARLILGNHELSLLRVAFGLREAQPLDTFGDVLADPDLADWVAWLRRCPLVVAGELGARPFVMAHAAVDPRWTLAEVEARARAVESELGSEDEGRARTLLRAGRSDDPRADDLGLLTRCRSVGTDGRWSSRDPRRRAEIWHRVWSERQHGYGVVYGHFAIQGLHVAPGLRGLDTGCVHNGWRRPTALTAWIPDRRRDDPFAVPDAGFWQAEARRRYYDERGPIPG